MKFLAAEGGAVALARFTADEVLVCAASVEGGTRTLRLPLSFLGALRPAGETDLLGSPLRWSAAPGGVILTLPPHSACLFDCALVE
jgi:hypothetical protein